MTKKKYYKHLKIIDTGQYVMVALENGVFYRAKVLDVASAPKIKVTFYRIARINHVYTLTNCNC